MRRSSLLAVLLTVAVFIGSVLAALTIPTDFQQLGTQPWEIGKLKSQDKSDNCRGEYDLSVEHAYNWRDSLMANAGRDPIFWATLAVAEKVFDGAKDSCVLCPEFRQCAIQVQSVRQPFSFTIGQGQDEAWERNLLTHIIVFINAATILKNRF